MCCTPELNSSLLTPSYRLLIPTVPSQLADQPPYASFIHLFIILSPDSSMRGHSVTAAWNSKRTAPPDAHINPCSLISHLANRHARRAQEAELEKIVAEIEDAMFLGTDARRPHHRHRRESFLSARSTPWCARSDLAARHLSRWIYHLQERQPLSSPPKPRLRMEADVRRFFVHRLRKTLMLQDLQWRRLSLDASKRKY